MFSLFDVDSSQSVLPDLEGVGVGVGDVVGSEKGNGVVLVNSSFESVHFYGNVVVELNSLSIGRGFSVLGSVKFDGVGVGELELLGLGGWELDFLVEVVLDVLGSDVVKSERNLFSMG